jgi:hypothetical protein
MKPIGLHYAAAWLCVGFVYAGKSLLTQSRTISVHPTRGLAQCTVPPEHALAEMRLYSHIQELSLLITPHVLIVLQYAQRIRRAVRV